VPFLRIDVRCSPHLSAADMMHLDLSRVEVILWIDPLWCAGDTVQNEQGMWASHSNSRFLVSLQNICLWPVRLSVVLMVSPMQTMLPICTWYQMLEKGAGSPGCAEGLVAGTASLPEGEELCCCQKQDLQDACPHSNPLTGTSVPSAVQTSAQEHSSRDIFQ